MGRFSEFFKWLFRTNDYADWTAADQLQAFVRGWGLFQTDYGDGKILPELQAVDGRNSDRFVWRQVVSDAARGDPLSLKALRILAFDNFDEYRAVINYGSKNKGPA
jgi:hypothetical protein